MRAMTETNITVHSGRVAKRHDRLLTSDELDAIPDPPDVNDPGKFCDHLMQIGNVCPEKN